MSRFSPLVLLPVLVFASVGHAQPLPDRAPLLGVTLGVKSQPLAATYLTLRRRESSGAFAFWGATTQADESGKFQFLNAEEGAYYLDASAPGYAPIQNLEVNWKLGAAPLRLQFTRLVDMTFEVRAPDGSVLANEPIFGRLRPDDPNGQILRNAATDAQGKFVLPGAKPGTYNLYFRAPQGFAQKRAIEVSEDDVAASIEVQLQAAGALRATLTDSRGLPLGGANLTLTLASGGDSGDDFALLAASNDFNAVITRDGDGSVELDGLPPGFYQPRFYLPGYETVALAPIEVKAGQIAQLKAQLPALAAPTLTLELRTNSDVPYTAGEVSVRVMPLASNGAMGGDDLPIFPGGPGGRRALPDPKGRITLFPVKAGNYRLFVTPRPQNPGEEPREATPVDVTIVAPATTATAIVRAN